MGMSSEFWAARRPGWVAAGLVVGVVSLTVGLLRAKSGANTANILALPVAVLSLGVAVRGLWPAPPLSRVARELADRIAQERGSARQQALGMSGDARPAEVAFRSPIADEEPELVRWRSDGGAAHGTLGDVADYYRSLDRGRLVILGEPGSGKTVLATQLVIDLAQGPPDGDLPPDTQPLVPVWLSLPSLDLGEIDSLARISAKEIAARLDQWIIAQMSTEYQVPKAAAERLIRERRILPVLDGLDEMDVVSVDHNNPPRPRAAAVVRGLNHGTGRRPVVLVCRRGEYTQLARSSGAQGEDPVMQDATQIVLQPLDTAAICDYLARRFPGELIARWKNVRQTLETTPTPAPADSLARVLSSPWRLFLATATYQDSDSDPEELIQLPADNVGEYLLGQLIPALTLRTPRPDGDHYLPGEVRIWLCTLAQHLDQTSRRLSWSLTDLHLERLWPIAGQAKVRRLSTLACAVILCAGFAVVGLLWVHSRGRWYPNTGPAWIGLIGSIGLIAIFSSIIAGDTGSTLNRLDIRVTWSRNRRRLLFGLAVGLAVGLAAGLLAWLGDGLLFGLAAGRAFGLAVGVAFGLAAGLLLGLTGTFSLAEQPTSVMRQNLAFGLAVGLVVGLAAGVALGVAVGVAFGLAVGLAAGLGGGLVAGLAVWVRYVIGCWLARREGTLPRQVGQFLDWAYSANLLRMSGTAIQFRHRELQTSLSSPPQALPLQIVGEQ
jgi:NACHT domain